MRCCEEPALFRMLWAEKSLVELQTVLISCGYTKEQAALRLRKMREAFPEASVSFPKSLLACCPGIVAESHKNVFAAAIRENAHVIVTWDTTMFPQELAEEFDIYVQSPDEFLLHQAHLNPDRVQDALDAQAATHRMSRSALLLKLAQQLPSFESELRLRKF